MFSTLVNTLEGRAAFMALVAGRSVGEVPDPSLAAPRSGRHITRVRGCHVVSRRMLAPAPVARELYPVGLNIAALAAAFAARLHDVDGDAFTDARAVEYAAALQNDMPRSRRALYCMSRDIFVTTKAQMATFNRVFAEAFGPQGGTDRYRDLAPVPATAIAGMR
jgi:hypothetical protein